MSTSTAREKDSDRDKAGSAKFQYQSIEPLEFVNYTPPTAQGGARLAVRFFEGEAEDTLTDGSARAQAVTGPVRAKGSRLYNYLELAEDLLAEDRANLLDEEAHSYKINGADYSREQQKGKGKLEPIPNNLDDCQLKLQSARNQLAATQQILHLMQNQSIHTSQELSAMARQIADDDPCTTMSGEFPFLVHCGSTPLLKKRINFPQKTEIAPRVIVGVQTTDPSAMVLAYASSVDREGFELHADLANYAKYVGRTDLLKGVVSWIAVEGSRSYLPLGLRKRARN